MVLCCQKRDKIVLVAPHLSRGAGSILRPPLSWLFGTGKEDVGHAIRQQMNGERIDSPEAGRAGEPDRSCSREVRWLGHERPSLTYYGLVSGAENRRAENAASYSRAGAEDFIEHVVRNHVGGCAGSAARIQKSRKLIDYAYVHQ